MAKTKKEYVIKVSLDNSKVVTSVEEVTTAVDSVNTAVDSASTSVNALSGTVDRLSGGMVSAFRAGLAGAKSMTAGMKTLRGAFMSTGLGALVVALGSLVSYFTSSEEGAAKLETITNFLGIAFEKIKGALAPLGEAIVGVFENPKQAIIDLWALIKEQIVNRVEGMIGQFKALGTILEGVFTLDFDKIMKGQSDFAEASLQAFTGVEDAAGKLAKAIDEVKQEMDDATAEAERFAAAKEALRVATNKYIVDNAKLTADIEKQQKIIDDTTLSYDVRKAALDKQNASTLQLAKNTADQAKQEEAKLRLELKNTTDVKKRHDLEREIAETVGERIAAESAVAIVRQDNAQKSREIDQEELQRIQDNFNTIEQLRIDNIEDERAQIEEQANLEEQAAIEELERNRATEEEIAAARVYYAQLKADKLKEFDDAAEETRIANEETLRAALATDQENEILAITEHYDELMRLAEGDALAQEELEKKKQAKIGKVKDDANKKDKEATRQLNKKKAEMALEAAQALGGLISALSSDTEKGAKRRFNIEKALGISTATVNTALAISDALAKDNTFPGSRFLAAATAGVAGAAQVATIASTQFTSSGGPPPSSGGGGGLSSIVNPSADTSAPDVDFGFLGEDGADQTAIQTYVVSQDVTNNQQADQLIKDQASL